MSITRNGDLICDCCGRIVIRQEKITEKDKKENSGSTICWKCWSIFKKGVESD